jgi:ABC-2 type transport system permease protein
MSELLLAPRAMTGRAIRLSLREMDGLILALVLPVTLLLLFVYLFGGAIQTGGEYVNYVVPGVLLVCVGFGAASTAVSVARDLEGGIIDRFRTMDVRGESILFGHVVASVSRNLLSMTLVFAAAFVIGFRSQASVTQWLVALAILVLYMTALSFLAAAMGVLARSAEAANGMAFGLSFVPYVSSAFVPIVTMPVWLQGVARNQPVTQVVDSVRGLLSGQPAGSAAWISALWCVSIAIAAIVLGGITYRSRTSG